MFSNSIPNQNFIKIGQGHKHKQTTLNRLYYIQVKYLLKNRAYRTTFTKVLLALDYRQKKFKCDKKII